MRKKVILFLSVLLLAIFSFRYASAMEKAPLTAPNIVVILTDDQAVGMVENMPYLSSLAPQTANFTQAVATTPMCCPSRASFLTGLLASNDPNQPTMGHRVLGNGTVNGVTYGWPAFNLGGYEADTLATHLELAGYSTGLFGKYFNLYNSPGFTPPGWDRWFAFTTKINYYGWAAANNGTQYQPPNTEYSTTTLFNNAVTFIQNTSGPKFLYVTPYAPHVPVRATTITESIWVEPQYRGVYSTLNFPFEWDDPATTEVDEGNFNYKSTNTPRWIRTLGLQSEPMLTNRWRWANESLLSVDDGLEAITQALSARGELENTIFVYASDNGLSYGSHRWYGKGCAYEECIRVPLLFWGAGVTPGTYTFPAQINDVPHTLLELAGATPFINTEGTSLAAVWNGTPPERACQDLEYWYGSGIIAKSWYGTKCGNIKEICTTDTAGTRHEIYDLSTDPYELRNLVPNPLVACSQ